MRRVSLAMDAARVAPDPELLADLAAGDRGALATIYHRHKDAVFNAAFHLVGGSDRAEDVLHDVFLNLVRKAGALELRGSLRSYLVSAAVHRCRDLGRRDAVRSRPLVLREEAAIDPALEVWQNEERALLTASLQDLPQEQREVVVLHVFEVLPFREVAELCGIPINTAMSRWRYALSGLRDRMRTKGVEG